MEYYSVIKKEWNNAIFSNMDRPRDYHSKLSKSDKDKYHDITHIWNLKIWCKWTYFQNRLTVTENYTQYLAITYNGKESLKEYI